MANTNIKMGPTTQFRNKDAPSTLVFLNTSFNLSYLTLVNGGYIIRIRPMASGILVVPDEKELMNDDDEGKKYPIATPAAIAIKIHNVRYLSRNPSFLRSCTGAQWFAVMFSGLVLKKG
jgi:hypothetical protein